VNIAKTTKNLSKEIRDYMIWDIERENSGWLYSYYIVACRWKPEYLNRSGRPLLDNGSVTRYPVSLSGWQLNTFTRQGIPRQTFPTQRIKPNCSIRCSLSGPQRIISRGWLTELMDSEGSDNEMRDSEEDAGQKRSRTVTSEAVNL
jgi:hypothetical protein